MNDISKKKPEHKDKKPAKEVTQSTETDILKQKIVELETQLIQMTNQWKRALADYQNLVKRTENNQKDFIQFAIKNFLEKLLGAIDDLEMAGNHLKDQGLALALKKFHDVLKAEGLVRIDTQNKEYDIHTMEAINIIEGDADNKVVTEHRPGYLLHGSVLRPAQVTVSKKK